MIVDRLPSQKVKRKFREKSRKRSSLHRENCSPSTISSSHLLSTGIRRACEVEERHVWLSQAPGRTLLVQIRSASIRLYRIPRTEVFIISFSLHAFICQIYILCLYLSLIRLNLNILHAFHLEILCSRKSLFSLQVVSEPGLGLGLHVLKHRRSDYDMHKLIRYRSKVDLGMISLDLE